MPGPAVHAMADGASRAEAEGGDAEGADEEAMARAQEQVERERQQEEREGEVREQLERQVQAEVAVAVGGRLQLLVVQGVGHQEVPAMDRAVEDFFCSHLLLARGRGAGGARGM